MASSASIRKTETAAATAPPQAAGAARGDGTLALFFRQPHALSAEAHGALGLLPVASYRFAAETNAIPIGADEFAPAQACYPIVFTASDPPMPVVVLGLHDRRNLFVDADGAWREGCYRPAHVRSYPFGLAAVEGRGDLVLAVDEGAGLLSPDGGEALFADGQPSETAQRALRLCIGIQQQRERVRAFAAALRAADLLVENRAEWRPATAAAAQVFGGFRIVDERRFHELPDATVLEWHRQGWLGLLYAHLMSMQRWPILATMTVRDTAASDLRSAGS